MIRKKKGPLEWLEFEGFQEVPGLTHGVFLRHGPFSLESQREVFGDAPIVYTRQVHGIQIEEVVESGQRTISDGLVTEVQGLGLAIQHADCQAALIVDPVRRVLANLHVGWRGNVQNLYGEAVRYLREKKGCRAEDLLVAISPSLGPCCGEFKNFVTEWPQPLWVYQVRPSYFDLWEMSRQQLIEAGVAPHHIEVAGICTCCNPGDFHSYRRDKTTERHATIGVFQR
jgi:hypothetical protein